MTISALILGGALFGSLAGFFVAPLRVGCTALLIVPVAMIGYVALWQSLYPELLRSTSAVDYVFGALWPSLGAIVGFPAGVAARLITRQERLDHAPLKVGQIVSAHAVAKSELDAM